MDISEKLKKERKERDLTQSELAKKINVSTSIIGDIESGRRLPSKKTVQKLASFFNTASDYWFSEKEVDEYFMQRKKYSMLDEIITTLIKSGKIKSSNISDECWDLIKDAIKIEIEVMLMKEK